MIRNLLLTILFIFSSSLQLIAQSEQITKRPNSIRSFDSRDGLNLSLITSLKSDNQGWLWIGGIVHRQNKYKEANQKAVIYRFNGSFFQKIELPVDYDKNFLRVDFYKLSETYFLMALRFEDDIEFYSLNTNTLVFTKKEVAFPIPTDYPYSLNYVYNDENWVFISSKSSRRIYKIDPEGNFSLGSPALSEQLAEAKYVANIKDSYLIGTDTNGFYKIDKTSGNSYEFQKNDIDPKYEGQNQKLKVNQFFTVDGNYIFSFDSIPGLFTFDPTNNNWDRTTLTKNQIHDNLNADESENVLKQKLTNDGTEVSIFNKNTGNRIAEFYLPKATNYQFASNDLSKTIYLSYRSHLYQVNFSGGSVMTFLKDYSIRSILPYSTDEYLIGTEGNGLFLININDGTERSYILKNGEDPFLPIANRYFINTQDTIWSNDRDGIILIHKKNQQVELLPFKRLTCLTEDDRYIYGGTSRNYLIAFDKKNKTFENIDRTINLDFSDIELKDNIIYGATNNGLYIFNGKESVVLKPSDHQEDDNLLFIRDHKDYDLLLGSRSGKLYAFDTKLRKFELIYADNINASLADLLVDDHDNLWINSFAGFIKYNPKTKSEIRFDESEGFSHYEANRHGSFKTNDGHFFIGTLRGLNYFHPDSLKLFENTAEFNLVSLQYFDTDLKRSVSIFNSKQLKNIKEIILPAEHRNLKIGFAIFKNETAQSISYRYTIDGEKWTRMELQNELNLVNLSPGKYKLKIEALNFEKERIGEQIELSIVSKDFFYKTTWFILLCIGIALGLITWYILILQKRQALLKQFSTEIIEAQEKQKTAIARELHDSVGQKLVLLNMQSKITGNATSEKLAKETLHELRNITSGLHPSVLERHGLTAATQSLVDSVDEITDTFIESDIDDIDHIFPPESELHIYRIVQEALSNMVKHSDSSSASVQIKRSQNGVLFSIQDFGKGFKLNTEKLNKVDGLGMKTLVERSKILNGKLEIKAKEGEGTYIKLFVPIITP